MCASGQCSFLGGSKSVVPESSFCGVWPEARRRGSFSSDTCSDRSSKSLQGPGSFSLQLFLCICPSASWQEQAWLPLNTGLSCLFQHKQGKVGPDGKELIPQDSPRVGGFGFVATPSPAPGE